MRTGLQSVLRQHTWIPVLCCLVAGVGGAFLAARRARTYVAAAMIRVNDANVVQDILSSVGPTGPSSSNSTSPTNLGGLSVQAPFADILSDIRNYRTGQRAVEFLQLDPFLSPNQVLDDTTATVDPTTNLVSISASSPNPRHAANIANALAEAYIDLRRHTDLDQLAAARQKLSGVAAWRAHAPDTRFTDLVAAVKPLTDGIAQLQLAALIGSSSVTLARRAAPPAAPAGTSPRVVGVIGALLGLVVGIGLMGTRQATDDRIMSIRGLRRALRAPHLASIPASRRLRHLLPPTDLESREIEPFRLLLARLLCSARPNECRYVTVMSAAENRAEIAAAWYLAAVAAESGARTLLIKSTGAPVSQQPTPVAIGAGTQLDVVTPTASPGGVLSPEVTAELRKCSHEIYDVVVVEAPAMGDRAVSLPFLLHSDVVAVCPGWDTDRPAARRFRQALESSEAQLVGFVDVGLVRDAGGRGPRRHAVDAPVSDTGQGTTHLRHRAARGLVSVGLRTVLVRAMSFVGIIVIAPLLGTSNYGVVAIGVTITMVGKFFADGGLNPGFIGRKQSPTHEELRALSAFQLIITTIICLVVAAIALGHGEQGLAVTVMASALIVDALRVPAVIIAERKLEYEVIVRAEVAEAFVYTSLSVGLVVAGFGVLGVGVATILRSLTGTGLITRFGRVGIVKPKWDFSLLRPTMRFGLFFQGAWLATILRDGGLNVLLAGIAGTAALGAWALAQRLLVILTILFESAWRVALPGLARLMEAGEPPRDLLDRGLSFAATGSGFPVAALVGTAPALVPALFGHQWDETLKVLPWVAGGAMIGVPVATVLGTLLWARGDAEKLFRMAAPAIALTLILAAGLIEPLGALGAAISYFVGQCVFVVTARYYARDLFGRDAVLHVSVPTIAAGVGGAVGWVAAASISDLWVGAVIGGVLAVGLYTALIVTFARAGMNRVISVLRQSLRPATS